MNLPGPGLVDAATLESLRADLRSLANDPDAARVVTLTTPTLAATFNTASGATTATTTSDTVRAYLAPLTVREVGDGEVYRLGDRRLFVDPSLLTVPPTVSSTVTLDGETWRAVTAEFDPLTAIHRLVIRRSSS